MAGGFLDLLRGGGGQDQAGGGEAPDAAPAATGAESAGGAARSPRLSSLAAQARKGGRRAAAVADELKREQQAAALEELFEGENWTEVACLYFDARFAITGDTCFELGDKKRKVLGLTMAKAMRVLTAIDPAYLALGLFVVHFGGTVAQCEMVYAQKQSAKKKDQAPARA